MLRIIPTPKKLEVKDGTFSLAGARIFVNDCADRRVVAAATVLAEEMSHSSGERIVVSAGAPAGNAIVIDCGNGASEAYMLTIENDTITLTSDGAAGAFYGIQTLRQIVKENGEKLPCCAIDDEPEFAFRGFYHDVSRGRVNTLAKLEHIADVLSYFKISSLQLYMEDAFLFKEYEGLRNENDALTPCEISELERYCHDRFIELIPTLSTFGHLFTLLQSEKYNYISELSDHKLVMNYWMERQWHHTVDVYNPDTIKVIGSMIEQYMPLFRSKYFNICCDETLDLCKGRNEGRDKGEAFFHHVDQLIALVKSHGKTVMMCGDECMARPELTKEHVPDDTVVVNWCYRKEVNEWIPKFFSELGFRQVCSTATDAWDAFIEDIDISVGNITSFSKHAKKYNALGILNTSWGDFGHVCPFNGNLFGTMFGAEKSWNVDGAIDEEFEKAASILLYDVREFNVVDTLRALGKAAVSGNWTRFVMRHSDNCINSKNTELTYGEGLTAKDAIANIDVCKKEAGRLKALKRDDGVITDLVIAAEGTALMNRLALYVNGVEGYTNADALQSDFNEWLERYSAAWLREDKPSELWRVQDFVKQITKIK
ncbi:MAG: beta-N-acetylhexosaminidase [Clostridia bacterium]|nr:beta-N-acetylhexosaminidase [Clostridia bacterium]